MIEMLRSKLKKRKGFTLIELIVVIAIIAILLSLAIPRLSGYTDMARKTADEQLAAIYKNTFTILVSNGTVMTAGKKIEIIVDKDGDIKYKDASGNKLKYYNAAGVIGDVARADNDIIISLSSSDPETPAEVITQSKLKYIQDEFITKNGSKGGTPVFQSKEYTVNANGIIITIDGTDRDTVTVQLNNSTTNPPV